MITTDAYAAHCAYWAATYEDGNFDPDMYRDDAGHERAEARMTAVEQGVQYFDELDADDWDDSCPF